MDFFSCNFDIENSFAGLLVGGIDEAGRGPIAGPVVASLAFLDKDFLQSDVCKKINDSKKISKKKRAEIYTYLCDNIKFGVGVVDEKKIDEINILNATKLAMKKAYDDFCNKYDVGLEVILVDGNFSPFEKCDAIKEILPVVKGDQKSLSIAAASIIAKEYRDGIMRGLHDKYPHFSWDRNAAYPTKEHIEKVREFGVCEFHRKSFEPIKSML